MDADLTAPTRMCRAPHGLTPSSNCTTGLLIWASRTARPTPLLRKRQNLDLTGGAAFCSLAPAPPPTVIELAEDLSGFALPPEEQAAVTIEKTEQGSRVTFTGSVAEATITRFTEAAKSADVVPPS